MSFLLKPLAATALLLCTGLVSTNTIAMPSFSSAKRALTPIYYELDQKLGQTKTIYCSIPIHYKNERNWYIKTENEDWYTPRNKKNKRSQKIEVEHVMSAWEFGHDMPCWDNGGRDNCGKYPEFDLREGDLHNLYPSVGEVNGDRSNYQFAMWNDNDKDRDKNNIYTYGNCKMFIDTTTKEARPPEEARGKIARAYLYMSQQYSINLSDQKRKLYKAWNSQYAPDEFECQRNILIKEKQGNDNPFISAKCTADGKPLNNGSKKQDATDTNHDYDKSEAQENIKKPLNGLKD